MKPEQVLSAHFMALSFAEQVCVAQSIGLSKVVGLTEMGLYKETFRLARKHKIMSKLWQEVESRHPKGNVLANPFK